MRADSYFKGHIKRGRFFCVRSERRISMQKIFRSSSKLLFREFLIIFGIGAVLVMGTPFLIDAFTSDSDVTSTFATSINKYSQGFVTFTTPIMVIGLVTTIIIGIYVSFIKHNIIFYITNDNTTMRHIVGETVFSVPNTHYYFSEGNKSRHIRAIEKRTSKWTDYKCTNFDDKTFGELIEYAKSKD